MLGKIVNGLPYPDDKLLASYPEFYSRSAEEKISQKEWELSQESFDRLYEYSTSRPTGVFIGKRWRCHTKGGDWLIGVYEEKRGECYTTFRWAINSETHEPFRGPK